jgi:hypothetical protein
MDKGPYLGTVLSNADPTKLGRIKASVPHVFGISDSELGSVGLNDIPWALPAGLPAGGSPASGGVDWLPEPGDQVLIFFLDNEPEKPVWMWLMQTLDQQASFPLHQYQTIANTPVPVRAGLTRYGHTIELNSGSALISTKSGYQLFMLNGDLGANNGLIQLQTPLGQFLELDDSTQTVTLSVLLDHYVNIGATWQAQADEIDFETLNRDIKLVSGHNLSADTVNDVNLTSGEATNIATGSTFGLDVATNYNATVGGNMTTDVTGSCNFTFATMNLGAAATHPFVLGDSLLEFLNLMMVYLAGHTHSNGNNGSPTGPPIVPPQATAQNVLDTILSTTIKGQ